MFAEFLKKLTAPDPDPLEDQDARLALTALLVRVARTDGTYSDAERARIERLTGERYGLEGADLAALVEQAETLEAEAPDTQRFTRAIKAAVAFEDRMSVIEALWSVAMADGSRDAGEDALLRMTAGFLGVSDRDSALARQRVTQSE